MAFLRGPIACLALVPALAAVPAAGGDAGPTRLAQPGQSSTPSLTVQSVSGRGTDLFVSLGSSLPSSSRGGVAQVDLYVPAGYVAGALKPGTSIGFAAIADVVPSSGDVESFGGALSTADPAGVDPASAACDAAPHVAVWKLSTDPGPVSYFFVDTAGPGDPAGTAYRIRLCPAVPAGSSLIGLDVLVEAEGLAEPQATGTYLWRAFLTPADPETSAPDPTKTYELRASAPLPLVLALSATYNPKSRRAVLTGQVTSLGRPAQGAVVTFSAHSAHVDFADFGPTTTDASGRFSYSWPISEKTDFTAEVTPTAPAPCPSDPAPPSGGCVSVTTAVPGSAQTQTRPPRKGDPAVQPRSADQALAARVNVQEADLPADWHSVSISATEATPCPDVNFQESKLTLTGAAQSALFYRGTLTSATPAIVLSSVKVWKSPADAQAAYLLEKPTAQLRCVLDDPSVTVVKSAPLALPRFGAASAAHRVVALENDDSGASHRVYLDLVEILGKRSITTIFLESGDAPPTVEKALGQRVGRRAAAV